MPLKPPIIPSRPMIHVSLRILVKRPTNPVCEAVALRVPLLGARASPGCCSAPRGVCTCASLFDSCWSLQQEKETSANRTERLERRVKLSSRYMCFRETLARSIAKAGSQPAIRSAGPTHPALPGARRRSPLKRKTTRNAQRARTHGSHKARWRVDREPLECLLQRVRSEECRRSKMVVSAFDELARRVAPGRGLS